MGVVRFYPEKDSFITNYRRLGVPQTGSNFGASEILELFKVAPISGSSSVISGSLSRILMQFNLQEISELTGSGEIPVVGVNYFLRLKNARHAETLPSSFDVEIDQLGQFWDEGRGLDLDTFGDLGYANWDKASSTKFWGTNLDGTVFGFPLSNVFGGGALDNPGGFTNSPNIRTTVHFDTGYEDLIADVTPQTISWLTGTVTNNGFIVHLSSTLESGSQDYFIKKFHSRQTFFKDYRPYLEAQWEDFIADDRNNFVWNNTGSLFLYNVVRGNYVNLTGINTGSNVLNVRIEDVSGSVLGNFSASFFGQTGIYSASFALTSGSNFSGSIFKDIWYSGSLVFMTGTFPITDDFSQIISRPPKYAANIINLQNEYESNEKVKFQVFLRNFDYNPAVVLTASSDPDGLVASRAYYRISNDRTDETIINFSTGTTQYSRLSYDQKGNYFTVYMRNFSPGEVYRISLQIHDRGTKQILDRGWKFRVV